MFLCSTLLLLQASAAAPVVQHPNHSALNSSGTTAFVEVLRVFRSWSTDSAGVSDEKPAPSGLTLEFLEKLGKRQAAEDVSKSNGFGDASAWQAYGARLFSAVQKVQIERVTEDAKRRLDAATESEREGLRKHLTSLEAAAASIKFASPLMMDEEAYIAKNVDVIVALLSKVSPKPRN